MWDFLAFVYAVIDNWAAFITGGIPAALFILYERWRNRPVSWRSFFSIFIILGFLAASFSAWREERHKVLVQSPESHVNSWLPLSPKEDIALSAELRSMTVPAPTVQVLCGLAACEALAESFMAIFSNLGWKPKYITGYSYEAPDGIQLWYRNDLERQIADAIEKATSGRLKISTHKFNAGVDQLNLAIGRKR